MGQRRRQRPCYLRSKLGDGFAEATEELGSIGGEVCTVVGLVVVGSMLLPSSAHALSATTTNASVADKRRSVIAFTSVCLPTHRR